MEPVIQIPSKLRLSNESENVDVLTNIYQEHCNLSVWKRNLPASLVKNINTLLDSDKHLKLIRQVTPDSLYDDIYPTLDEFECAQELITDMTLLVDMFCCLFDLKQAGLRMAILNQAMCPKFHVDKVPCRLITTYAGSGTQWLPNELVDRLSLDLKTAESHHIAQLSSGDVALLKGESWPNNQNAGLVHRSPELKAGEKRLILTLDIVH
ncbi:DUF1826 domain-containing protein [Catenovulum sp. 2E275]|uniref:DUF1826 domain-containing protein n=1 Tax=Catenovulum sp. 2E275 TaxID=2980497 RepID=UPI0021D3BFD7|nr:DUF1826 domain-containing protein [Catenovulum sp. 2E275]MCU4677003.1 DUF1826 domain-containing protein [Catenovulum sp. 2E275]